MTIIYPKHFRLLLSFVALFTTLNTFSQGQQELSTDSLLKRISLLEQKVSDMKKLYVGGFMHVQWSASPQAGVQRVGDGPNVLVGESDYNRVGIRRGRIITSYEDKGLLGFLQCDLTEKGVLLVDAFIHLQDPWLKTASLNGGLFSDPFGLEVPFATFNLESIEKSRVIKTIFPDDKDLGAVVAIQPRAQSSLSGLKVEAGLLTGNGLGKDADNYTDFIAHLTFNKTTNRVKYGLGASLYLGKVINHKGFYEMEGKQFALAADTAKFADRIYYGLEGQMSRQLSIGTFTVRGEFVWGKQPGTSDRSVSPGLTNIITGDTYLRRFSGGYIHLVQNILNTEHSLTLKYDWYDPNTRLSGNEIGVSAFSGKGDIAYSTIGLGYLYRMSNHVRLMAYYEMVANEKSRNLVGYEHDLNDNVLTLRMQYWF